MRTFGLVELARVIATLALIDLVAAATNSLPSYPLAVKNPYLSAWLPSSCASTAATCSPQFWTGSNLTWTVVARVGSKGYTLLGASTAINNTVAAKQNSITYTSSHTIINYTAGNANITLDFFSPVLPATADFARQSLPYSYLTVSAQAISGSPTVQILTAIDNTWTAQKGASQISYNQTASSIYFEFNNPNAIPYTEVNDQATYGSIVFGTTSASSTSYQCGSASAIYKRFISNGGLTGLTTSTTPPSCSNTSLVALSSKLGGQTTRASTNVTFAIGFDRVDAINYLGNAQTGYYRSQWPTIPQQVDYFLSDYSAALATSKTFDAQVRNRALTVSSNYADILEASVRQTFGAIEITIPASTMNATSPNIFLKEISSDGNVNTVDVIFPTFPIFISMNPTYLKLLLQPIMEYLVVPVSQGGWPKAFCIHDIGSSYPNATGHPKGIEEDMPLYETSALLQMIYAYQKYTGDKSWSTQYNTLLNGYANYLVQNGLYPTSQLISVDAISATANQTHLAVQSAIGLQAAALVLSNTTYKTTAASFANQIYTHGLGLDGSTPANSTHFTYNYGKSSTWGTIFSIYPDVLLNLSTFPAAAYAMEGAWLLKQNQPAGLPFFGPYNYTSSLTGGGGCDWSITDWSFWTSAATGNQQLITDVIDATHAFITNGMNTEPFGTKYVVQAPGTVGQWIGNRARSTVGANFALLALEQGLWPNVYSQ